MSKLNIDQKTIKDLFTAKKDDFVESSILDRDKLIISSFMNYLVTQGLND